MILHTLAKSPGSSDRSWHELACRGLKDSISLCHRLFPPTISCAKKAFYLLPYKPLHYHKLQSVHTNTTLHIFIKPQIRSVPFLSQECSLSPFCCYFILNFFCISRRFVAMWFFPLQSTFAEVTTVCILIADLQFGKTNWKKELTIQSCIPAISSYSAKRIATVWKRTISSVF